MVLLSCVLWELEATNCLHCLNRVCRNCGTVTKRAATSCLGFSLTCWSIWNFLKLLLHGQWLFLICLCLTSVLPLSCCWKAVSALTIKNNGWRVMQAVWMAFPRGQPTKLYPVLCRVETVRHGYDWMSERRRIKPLLKYEAHQITYQITHQTVALSQLNGIKLF